MWRITDEREVDGEGDEHEHGGGQPVLALAGEPDGEDGAADDPRAGERAAEVEADLAADVRASCAAWRSSATPAARWRIQATAPTRVAEQRQAGERHERQRGDDEHDVEVAQEGSRCSGVP